MLNRSVFGFSLISFLCLLLVGCSLRPVIHEGTSMKPALGNGDKILIDKNFGELKRGDIVVFLFPRNQSQNFIKRIVGLPNETLEIRSGKVFINGQELTETYVNETYNQAKATRAPITIPADNYFVIGDNRDNSFDSRAWGTLSKDLIYGKYYSTYLKAEEK